MKDTQRIGRIVAAEAWHMAALEAVAGLGQADIWIGAGFLRNLVWDRLHGFAEATPLNDIDVIYFDPENTDRKPERDLEAHLRGVMAAPWSVKNQARMHERNGDAPYDSVADALCHWLETPTAVAVRLGPDGLEILAPLGLGDLMSLILRPTPHALKSKSRHEAYLKRIAAKPWTTAWPKLRVLDS